MAIDWDFLKEVEVRKDSQGNYLRENTAYVPKRNGAPIQNSSVTIGVGIDLGQQSEEQLRRDGVPEEVIAKLRPFLGKAPSNGDDPIALLQQHGAVTLTDEELDSLERPIKNRYLRDIRNWYNTNNTAGQDFSDLSDKQQTVLLSVYWNHGRRALTEYNFGRQVAEGRWGDVATNLRNFYSSEDNELHSRRVKEVQYLIGARVDGKPGDETAAKLDEFRANWSVDSFDQQSAQETSQQQQPSPQAPSFDPLGFLDDLALVLEQRRQAPSRASEEVSEGVTEPEQRQQVTRQALMERMAGSRAVQEGRLKRTYQEVKLEQEAKEAPSVSRMALMDRMAEAGLHERLNRKAVGIRESEPPVTINRGTMEEHNGDRDPTYGIF